MDGFKGKSNFFEAFVGVYCGLDLIRICTFVNLETFYFASLQDKAVSEIKECVSSWPAFSALVKNTATEVPCCICFLLTLLL